MFSFMGFGYYWPFCWPIGFPTRWISLVEIIFWGGDRSSSQSMGFKLAVNSVEFGKFWAIVYGKCVFLSSRPTNFIQRLNVINSSFYSSSFSCNKRSLHLLCSGDFFFIHFMLTGDAFIGKKFKTWLCRFFFSSFYFCF